MTIDFYQVTLFSAPNYCGEFDNAGGMMSVDETLMCSFQVKYQIQKYKHWTFVQGSNYRDCDLQFILMNKFVKSP